MLNVLLSKATIGAVVRHVMTAGGVWLAGNGLIDPVADAAALDAITGGVVAATGLAWSIINKRKAY